MKDQEQLREQYEDALFAMMMGALASREGEKALEENKRLQDDPDAAVPGQIDRKCMQTIRSHFRKNHMRKAGRTARKALGIAAMVFGIFSALFVGAFAMSEDVRLGTMNLVVKTFKECTDFYYVPFTNESIPQIKAGWVPEGWSLKSESSDVVSSWFSYVGDSEGTEYVRAIYALGNGSTFSIDTENSEIKTVQVQGVDAMLVLKGETLQLTWEAIDKSGFVTLTSEGLTEEQMLKVAEALEY